MLSVGEIKERTEQFFRDRGVPDPKLDTDLLIAEVLGLRRLDLYLDLDRPLTEAELERLRPLVRRRASREPLQYILGSTTFDGLTLKVDQRALVPRPETEELVAHVVDALRQPPATILDLGTGTGALVLALANRFENAKLVAVEQDAKTLDLARENADALGLADRVELLQSDWFETLEEGACFDLIVSNPPYLTEDEWGTAEPEVRDHEPKGALVSGKDGLDALREIMKRAPGFLSKRGLLALETGIGHREPLLALAAEAGFEASGLDDLSGRPRFILARRAGN